MIIAFLFSFFSCSTSYDTDTQKQGYDETIELPGPQVISDVSLEESINNRRSVREFEDKGLSLKEISQLLWSAQGITDQERGFRSIPSAGALYPLEIFVVSDAGIYRYIPENHEISCLFEFDKRLELAEACVSQDFISDAPASIIITGILSKTEKKYGERALRYVYLEAGHCCQNILLQATAIGLGAVPVGAFYDTEILKILGLDDSYTPIYVIPIGHIVTDQGP